MAYGLPTTVPAPLADIRCVIAACRCLPRLALQGALRAIPRCVEDTTIYESLYRLAITSKEAYM
jgi:hypothetical protein